MPDDNLVPVLGSGVVRRFLGDRRAAGADRPSRAQGFPTDCPLCGMRVIKPRYVTWHLITMMAPSPSYWFTDDDLVELCPLHQMLAGAEAAGPADAA